MLWNPEIMATGVEIVDNQHQEIIRRVNAVSEKVNDNSGDYLADIDLLIDFLADYVIVHFQSEETLQQEIFYSGYNSHKAEHDGFTSHFIKTREHFWQTGATSQNIRELIEMTEAWLTEHIAGSDAQFAKAYKSYKQL